MLTKKTSHLKKCDESVNILFVSHTDTTRSKTLEFIDTQSNIITKILTVYMSGLKYTKND